jgi:hypothetical protein
MRRHKLLTELQATAFRLRLDEERAAREAALEAERARYACLPEAPITEAQYREIIGRNAYLWAAAKFENGRFVLVSQEERKSRLKHLRGYTSFLHKRSPSGELVECLENINDVDLKTNLSLGVINLVTGLVAWRKEPKPYNSITYQGNQAEIAARNRRLGEYYRTFIPPFP